MLVRLVDAVKELTNQYESGLITEWEFACKLVEYGLSVPKPLPGDIDENTGLSYPKE